MILVKMNGVLMRFGAITNSHRIVLLFKWKIKYEAEEKIRNMDAAYFFSHFTVNPWQVSWDAND